MIAANLQCFELSQCWSQPLSKILVLYMTRLLAGPDSCQCAVRDNHLLLHLLYLLIQSCFEFFFVSLDQRVVVLARGGKWLCDLYRSKLVATMPKFAKLPSQLSCGVHNLWTRLRLYLCSLRILIAWCASDRHSPVLASTHQPGYHQQLLDKFVIFAAEWLRYCFCGSCARTRLNSVMDTIAVHVTASDANHLNHCRCGNIVCARTVNSKHDTHRV